MKRIVTIAFEIDMDDYEEVDCEEGAVEIGVAMFAGETDMPEKFRVTCGEVSRAVDADEI